MLLDCKRLFNILAPESVSIILFPTLTQNSTSAKVFSAPTLQLRLQRKCFQLRLYNFDFSEIASDSGFESSQSAFNADCTTLRPELHRQELITNVCLVLLYTLESSLPSSPFIYDNFHTSHYEGNIAS